MNMEVKMVMVAGTAAISAGMPWPKKNAGVKPKAYTARRRRVGDEGRDGVGVVVANRQEHM
jgi:hypothetical protein